MIKVKEFIKTLKTLDQEQYVKVACDEEWNTIFNDVKIGKDGEHGAYVIFGLSGSEEESYEDVIDHKFDHNIEPGEGEEQCPNCNRVVNDNQIYTTHEDNEHPDNITYCVKCQEEILVDQRNKKLEQKLDEENLEQERKDNSK